jgi:hypothetical protein
VRIAVEKLLAWYVPIAFIAFAAWVTDSALHDSETLASAASALGLPPLHLRAPLKVAQSTMFVAGNIVVAVWLAHQQHTSPARRSLWSLFGVASGLWAAGLWVMVQVSERRSDS